MADNSTALRFRCTLTNTVNSTEEIKRHRSRKEEKGRHFVSYLKQREGKKSSFFLDAPSNDYGSDDDHDGYRVVEKPAHVFLDVEDVSNDNGASYRFGGVEIVSNSRNVEVYTADEDGKEVYLLTSRGVLLDSEENEERASGATTGSSTDWYKAVVVHPGGPGTIHYLKLKLLSLKAPKNVARLRSFKLTGRLPEAPQRCPAPNVDKQKSSTHNDATLSATKSTPNSERTQSSVDTSPPRRGTIPSSSTSSTQGISQEDLKTAVTTFTMISRSTEDRLSKQIKEQSKTLRTILTRRLDALERQNAALRNELTEQRGRLAEYASVNAALLKEQREERRAAALFRNQIVEMMMMNDSTTTTSRRNESVPRNVAAIAAAASLEPTPKTSARASSRTNERTVGADSSPRLDLEHETMGNVLADPADSSTSRVEEVRSDPIQIARVQSRCVVSSSLDTSRNSDSVSCDDPEQTQHQTLPQGEPLANKVVKKENENVGDDSGESFEPCGIGGAPPPTVSEDFEAGEVSVERKHPEVATDGTDAGSKVLDPRTLSTSDEKEDG